MSDGQRTLGELLSAQNMTLLAEVERLAAEVARLTEERAFFERNAHKATALAVEEFDRANALRAERDAALAREAALREALAPIIGAYTSGDYCGWCQRLIAECSPTTCAAGRARAALAAAGGEQSA